MAPEHWVSGRNLDSIVQLLCRENRTREFLLEVLVVFIAIFVCCDIGAGFGVAHVLHLVGVFFYAYFAEVPQGAQYC